jgi:hypothetical protein
MNHNMFSHDEDLASMMLSSDLLNKACTAISVTPVSDQDPFSISIHVSGDLLDNGKIIAFRSSPNYIVHNLQVEEVKALVPSTETFFDFISTKINPSISINKVAVEVFSSLFQNYLSVLQDQIDISKPLIVTGNSLGGSIASLFTIWLLDTIYLNKSARPICITFGAALLGDIYFRKAIYERSSWPSCFVHVAHTKDPNPMLYVSPDYNPFGLFFFCSDSGCVCMDHPESVIEVMDVMKSVGDTDFSVDPFELYGKALDKLKRNATYKGNSILGDAGIDSLQVGIVLQLEAIEVIRKEEKENEETRSLIKNIKKRKEGWLVRLRHVKDEKKNLNEIKIGMAYLEWYKMKTKDDGGYYSAYKKPSTPGKRECKYRIKKEKAKLNVYWDKMVKKAMQKPQKEAVSFRNSWLFAGLNYRRMVEPLEIADYYLSGKTDYINTGRPEYLKMLEKWFDDDRLPQTSQTIPSRERRKAASLTEDSLFWAYLEEAYLSLNVLKNIPSSEADKNLAVNNLMKFEEYVMGLIGDYSVSPEIFLPKSTFMDWWVEYKHYKDGTLGGASYSSSLAKFMTNRSQAYA